MKLTLLDKKKKDLFVAIFQVLKNCSSLINVMFEQNVLHIQGMDKSHVCLFDVKLTSGWFNEYSVSNSTKISFDSATFHSIISTKSEGQLLSIKTDNNNQLCVDFISDVNSEKENEKCEFKKFFTMPLADYEYEEMAIPDVEYEAEFSISSKKIAEIFSQLENFGGDLNIKCTEDNVDLIASGISGVMRVNIPVDDLSCYSIVEDEEIDLRYSLTYINKLCLTNKLSTDIDFCISIDRPMKISYNLGGDSLMVFHIAPKINE